MVYVRLEQDWTDDAGNQHHAGETVDVDAVTLARLESQGLVAEPEDPGDRGDDPDSWGEPTGGNAGTSSWGEPTGGDAGTSSWGEPTGTPGASR